VVPQTEFVTTSITGQQTQFSGVRYLGGQMVVPAELSISHSSQGTSSEQVIEALLERLSLEKVGDSTNFWRNTQQQSLTLNAVSGQYQLRVNSSEDAVTSTRLSQDELIQRAQQQLANYFPNLALQANTKKILFYEDSHEVFDTTTLEQAGLARIPFTYVIDGFPTSFRNTASEPFNVVVTTEGVVTIINFYPQFLEITSAERIKTISTQTAISNINLGRGSIISAYLEGDAPVPTDLAQISSGDMTEAAIEYRFDESINTIYPFYKFKGSAVNGDGNSFKVEIITPAVATNP